MRPCFDTVDIVSRRSEEIGQQPDLTALEGGKLPGTALEVFNHRLNEIGKFKIQRSHEGKKEKERKKERMKERKKG